MKRLFSRKRIVFLAVLAVAAISAVAAYAYFTSSGTGSGTATVGTDTGLVIAQDAYGAGYPAVNLLPGATTQPLQGTVTNNATFSQGFDTIVATINAPTGPNVAGGVGVPACTAADFAFSTTTTWAITGTSDGTATLALPATEVLSASGGVYHWSGLAVKLVESGLNQDACKGATANIGYAVSYTP